MGVDNGGGRVVSEFTHGLPESALVGTGSKPTSHHPIPVLYLDIFLAVRISSIIDSGASLGSIKNFIIIDKSN